MQIRHVLVLAILLAAAGCSSSNSTPSPSPTTTTGTGGTTSGSGSSTTVSIVAGSAVLTTTAYAPNPVTIKVGDSITWVNNDSIAHTSTSNTSVWNTGTIVAGGSAKTTFNTAGSFPYHCAIHPGMVGTVTVQ